MNPISQTTLGLIILGFLVASAFRAGETNAKIEASKGPTCTQFQLYAAGFTVTYHGAKLVEVGQ